MFEEVGAGGVEGGGGGVRLEGARGEFVGEVFACVEVFEEAGGCFEVLVDEVDGAVLFFMWEDLVNGWVQVGGGKRDVSYE